jgi:hypothetical protein
MGLVAGKGRTRDRVLEEIGGVQEEGGNWKNRSYSFSSGTRTGLLFFWDRLPDAQKGKTIKQLVTGRDFIPTVWELLFRGK